jgi:hypothetical protein
MGFKQRDHIVMALRRAISLTAGNPSVTAVLLGNIVPVVGVLFLGWDAFDVVFVYWLENAVIGVFNVLKMLLAGPTDRAAHVAGGLVWKAFLIPFFCVHYGGFMAVHLMFIFFLLGSRAGFASPGFSPFERVPELFSITMLVALIALVVEHAYEFYRNFWKAGRYKETHAMVQMFQPYVRIIVLHVSVLFGAFLLMAFSFPSVMAVLLIAIKTGIELLRPATGGAGTVLGLGSPLPATRDDHIADTRGHWSQLRPPPRDLPAGITWQIVRASIGGGAAGGLVFGLVMTTIGVAWLLMGVIARKQTAGFHFDQPEFAAPIAVVGGLITLGGVLIVAGVIRSVRRRGATALRLLREGSLEPATLMEVRDANTNRWRPFRECMTEFHKFWTGGLPGLGVTPRLLGIRPSGIECRFRFQLPDGREITADAKLDLTGRVQAGNFELDDVALYDPANPRIATLLSGMSPPLQVSADGGWQAIERNAHERSSGT